MPEESSRISERVENGEEELGDFCFSQQAL